MQTNRKKKLLYPMSRIAPKRDDIDSVEFSKRNFGNRRAFDILMQAQFYWNQMDTFRRDRERNKRYTYGDQWGDTIVVDGSFLSADKEAWRETNPRYASFLFP